MWEYIVMGQIPGTRFEVDFTLWLLLVALPASVWLAYKTARPIRIVTKLIRHSEAYTALHVSYIMQTAAYTQLLLTRRHIQA